MKKSEQIDLLASALCDFQKSAPSVYKDTQGYGYKYADFSQILNVCRPHLERHGLVISQLCSGKENYVSVETVLMHKSGQWISSKLAMEIEAKKGLSKAQCAGATITYAKRYAYCSVIGIQSEEDTDAGIPRAEILRDLIKEKGIPASKVKAILASFGVSKLTELPGDVMDKLIVDLEKSTKQEAA